MSHAYHFVLGSRGSGTISRVIVADGQPYRGGGTHVDASCTHVRADTASGRGFECVSLEDFGVTYIFK
jgi:hypothetical protein